MRRLTSALLLLVFGFLAAAQNLPRATPAEVGFSAARLDHIAQVLREDAGKGLVPGSILLVARHGKIVYFESAGTLNPATKAPMTKDAIFRIYSMSKAVTSVSAMMMVEEGRLALSDPVAKYIPQSAKVKVGVEKPGEEGGKATPSLVGPARSITTA